jgi:cation transport regulator ChaB
MMIGGEIGAILAAMCVAEQAAIEVEKASKKAMDESFEQYLDDWQWPGDDNKTAKAYRCAWCRIRMDHTQIKCTGCGAPT